MRAIWNADKPQAHKRSALTTEMSAKVKVQKLDNRKLAQRHLPVMDSEDVEGDGEAARSECELNSKA